VSGIWARKLYDLNDMEKQPKLLVRLNRTDREERDFESLKEVTSMRRCLSG